MSGNDPIERPPTMRRDVTIIDIARETGTSKTTVSRVLNGEPSVAPATRVLITEAAARLGYRANRAARSLRTSRSALVGFLVPHLNEVFGQQAERLAGELREHGIDLVISTSGWNADAEARIIESMASRGVDALVVSLADDRAPGLVRVLRDFDRPLVLLDREVRGVRADTILTDQSTGMTSAIAHLAELGHVRIGLVAMTGATRPGREQQAAWHRAMEQAGLSDDAALVASVERFERASGAAATADLLAAGATAFVVCVPEAVMAGVLVDLHARGLSVPRDISLVGYHEPLLASAKEPRIAAITRDYEDMGAIAGRLAVTRLANTGMRPRVEIVATGFVTGTSTAPPK
jgi:LacI family transcriptional regulator